MDFDEKNRQKCEIARRKWIRKLKWIMSLKAGDIVTRIVNIPESLGHCNFSLWPVEYIKRSYVEGIVPTVWSDNVVDLRHLRHLIVEIPRGAEMMLTGVTEPGYLNDSCDRFSFLGYFYADDEKRKQIVDEYERELGPGVFHLSDKLSLRYSLLIPFPQVMILGSGLVGYAQPNIFKRLKGGTDDA